MAQEQKPRIIFMGTPLFAAIILDILQSANKFDIVGVCCGPDRKSGRGMKITFSETKKMALNFNLPVLQPATLKSPEVREELEKLNPDFLVVAAYGLLLPQDILSLPRYAAVNVHASLLPAYRGAAPIQRAIMENWHAGAKTGISIMQMVKGLDAGPVYAQEEVEIAGRNRSELEKTLAETGGRLLVEILEKIAREEIKPQAQNEEAVTWAPKLEKEDGIVNWRKTVAEVDALVRGVTPWPGAQTTFMLVGKAGELPVTLLPGKAGETAKNLQPGEIQRTRSGLQIACSDGWYIPGGIRPEGHKTMSPVDFANGHCRVKSGLCGVAHGKK